MTSECEHERLNVIWGDSGAYYERTNEITVVNDEYTTTTTGEWGARDGGGHDEEDKWLIHINCKECKGVIYSENETVSQDISQSERDSLTMMVREMGA